MFVSAFDEAPSLPTGVASATRTRCGLRQTRYAHAYACAADIGALSHMVLIPALREKEATSPVLACQGGTLKNKDTIQTLRDSYKDLA